jgi:hypothetical protein
MVHAIDLNIDNSVKREVKNLAILQNTDPQLEAINEGLKTYSTKGTKYLVNNEVLSCKGDKEGQNWQAMLPECLERKLMKSVHPFLGHLGSDKCYAEIKDTFHFRNLGRKLRKFIAACDLRQRTKHMNRAYDVTKTSPPETSRRTVCCRSIWKFTNMAGKRQIHFCMFDVFSK